MGGPPGYLELSQAPVQSACRERERYIEGKRMTEGAKERRTSQRIGQKGRSRWKRDG